MKKFLLCLLAALAVLTSAARAVEVPEDLERARPRDWAALLRDAEY